MLFVIWTIWIAAWNPVAYWTLRKDSHYWANAGVLSQTKRLWDKTDWQNINGDLNDPLIKDADSQYVHGA